MLRLAVCACLVAACYSPSLQGNCNIECSTGTCPDDMSCVAGFCRAEGDSCPMPDGPPGMTGRLFTKITAGDHHACAIDGDGKLVCWGGNEFGQIRGVAGLAETIGIEISDDRVAKWFDVAAGGHHTCAIGGTADGEDKAVYCWGRNIDSQAGVAGSEIASITKVNLVNAGVPLELAAGAAHSCVITDPDGRLFCWGSNSKGQLDDVSSTTAMPKPVAQQGTAHWVHVAAGGESTCATTDDGKAYCWGHNGSGQLGTNVSGNTGIPGAVVVPAPSVKSIDIGLGHACAINTESNAGGDIIRCWGANLVGQLGLSPADTGASPIPVIPDGDAVNPAWSEVHTGNVMSCAINDGLVYCWGIRDDSTALGDNCQTVGCRENAFGPLPGFEVKSLVTVEANAFALSLGVEFGCALFGDRAAGGVARCWGDNTFGQLGNGVTSFVQTATKVAESGGWSSVKLGENHGCAVKSGDGSVWCWGDNQFGQVDPDNPLLIIPSPVQVGNVGPSIDVALGYVHSCALLDGLDVDGNRVRCWGSDVDNQLGIPGDTMHFGTPPLAAGAWKAILSADDTTCVVSNTPSETQCWGFNKPPWANAAMDIPRPLNTPEQVGSLLRMGDVSLCSVISDVLTCAGVDIGGMRGDGPGETVGTDPPSAVTGSIDAAELSDTGPHGTHRCAARADGTTICWGNNNNKQVTADTTVFNAFSPVDVKIGATPFKTLLASSSPTTRRISTGHEFTCAIQETGDLYCWGNNDAMQLTKAGTPQKDPADGILYKIEAPASFQTVTAGRTTACAIDTAGDLYCWGDSKKGVTGTGISDLNHFDDVRTQ